MTRQPQCNCRGRIRMNLGSVSMYRRALIALMSEVSSALTQNASAGSRPVAQLRFSKCFDKSQSIVPSHSEYVLQVAVDTTICMSNPSAHKSCRRAVEGGCDQIHSSRSSRVRCQCIGFGGCESAVVILIAWPLRNLIEVFRPRRHSILLYNYFFHLKL